ncbi:hypothetical protein BRETT_000337 [Brettanomyces bruxellensis]|uniref:1-phosphatidylinositol 4-kinase n=1 Tax=Dekkera bruxellensis TaxID=5007 RepID=A0A871R1Y4_DEKBR|nr:uncharacterized protein BRETT_000337 [Brettanomyces bruxellensis]QOU20627.1 hypothetical protein BRETT_000337 [Brettanomyces bruxellensis]
MSTEKEKETAPSNADLWTTIHSSNFDIYKCIDLLRSKSENVGIQYELCKRATNYPMAELRFFIPQLLQLLITVDTQSLALTEMIEHLCTRDPHFCLVTFWNLQALLQQLCSEPESIGFQTCKKLINELQYQLFNYSQRPGSKLPPSTSGVVSHGFNQGFHENLTPSLILQTSLMAAITVPETVHYVEPMVRIQGKKVKTLVFEVLKDVKKSLTENLTRKNTIKNSKLGTTSAKSYKSEVRRTKSVNLDRKHRHTSTPSSSGNSSNSIDLKMVDSYADINLPELRRPSLKLGKAFARSPGTFNGFSSTFISLGKKASSKSKSDDMVASMPDLGSGSPENMNFDGSYATSIRNSFDFRDSLDIDNAANGKAASLSPERRRMTYTKAQKVKLLKSNYFNNTTQFVIALQNISARLSKTPREARLSTLKAELSVLNSDLPCEVDIPSLLPKSKRGKYHKICHICVNESAVLNSAEHVPFLLLIEYFSDGMDFNPDTPSNKYLLEDLQNGNDDGKYRFDISYRNTTSKTALKPISQGTGNHTLANATSSRTSSISKKDGSDFSTPLPEIVKKSDIDGTDLGDVSVVKFTNKMEDKDALMFPTKSFFANDKSLHDQIKDIEGSLNEHQDDSNEHDKNLTVQMRVAGVMLRQLELSQSTLANSQALQIKNRIVKSMKKMQDSFESSSNLKKTDDAAGVRKLSNDFKVAGLSYLGEDWNKKKQRIRKHSMYGKHENWDLYSMIAKTGEDLAQEAFASQLIQIIANIWYADGVHVWVKRMHMLITSSNTGLVETITNAFSVHSIKKSLTEYMISKNELQAGEVATLKDHFLRMFGDEDSMKYKMAQQNFCSSLAAYSIICYLLQIKDRHNGNIMVDSEGHIIHIDFGFLLSSSPGSVGFESAPFKLVQEYVDVLGGVDSFYFQQYKKLTKEAFKSIRKHADSLLNIVELMQTDSPLPCFRAGESTSVQLQQRLQLHLNDEEVDAFTENVLIAKSLNSVYTRLYDQFQMITQGIYM